MCAIDDCDERVSVLATTTPRARLAHRCAECGRVIDPGETYLRETFLWEGKMETHRTCEHCRVARSWLEDQCGGFLYGGVEEDIREHCNGSGYSMGLYRIAVGMAWMWRTPRGRLLPVPVVPPTGHDIAAARRA